MTLTADEQVEELRRTANDLLITVIDRAKAQSTLRQDFVGEDLVLLLISTSAVMESYICQRSGCGHSRVGR